MSSSTLAVVSPYSRLAASYRVRVATWLELTGVPAETLQYAGLGNNGPMSLLRHPLRVAKAHRRLNSLGRSRPSRILLHQEAAPLSRGGIEERLLTAAEFSIVDIDDGHPWDRRSGVRQVFPKAAKFNRSLRSADRVIAGNEYLADFVAPFTTDVIVIPSCVVPDRYRMKTNFALGDPPVLGWIGSKSGERYLASIGDALLEVHRKTGARLNLVGDVNPSLGKLESIIDRTQWSEESAGSVIAKWDVGLMPVADRLTERGKCGYKLIEYGASGLPAIASPVGVNLAIAASLHGLVPSQPADWVDAIMEMLTAPSSRREAIGQAARTAVEKAYSYEAWASTWLAAVGSPSATKDRPRNG